MLPLEAIVMGEEQVRRSIDGSVGGLRQRRSLQSAGNGTMTKRPLVQENPSQEKGQASEYCPEVEWFSWIV